MAHKLRKADAEAIAQELDSLLLSYGPKVDGWYTVETYYGTLKLRIDVSAGDQVATVFARFDDPDKARGLPSVRQPNPHSGKWNFHEWAQDAHKLPIVVDNALYRITGGTGARSVLSRAQAQEQ